MNILYLECNMGAAGDMFLAALFELLEDKEGFLKKLNTMGLDGVETLAVPEEKCGILGTRMAVRVNGHEEGSHSHHHEHHHHEHSTLGSIQNVIEGLKIPENVKKNALEVYKLLAAAESRAHGRPVELVHFHEVGAKDAVFDIVGVSLALDILGVDKIITSPINTGSGKVHTSHGVLPVPAPATAHLLMGLPSYSDGTDGELCTPTGAALIKYFSSSCGPMPKMIVEKIGYGMGKKNFKAANCVRAFLGRKINDEGTQDKITELRCNLDDMTPEALGHAMDILLKNGALDAYIQPVYMKKNRPGFVAVCLCREADSYKFARLMLMHTTTLGVRKVECERYILSREIKEKETPMGKVRIKYANGHGVLRIKPEYDDVARVATEKGISFDEAYNAILLQIRDE